MMCSERLSSQALLHIYRDDFPVDLDNVICVQERVAFVRFVLIVLWEESIKLFETDSSCGICGNIINKAF